MSDADWPAPEPASSREPERRPAALPRIEDLPIAEQGYDREHVREAFDAFYRHAAQLDATLRTLEAVEVFQRTAAELRAELRTMRGAGWTVDSWRSGGYGTRARVSEWTLPPAFPRVAAEAVFLIVVGVVVGVTGWSNVTIVVVMGAALALVWLIEWVAARERAIPRAVAPAAPPALDEEPAELPAGEDEAWRTSEEGPEAMTMLGAPPVRVDAEDELEAAEQEEPEPADEPAAEAEPLAVGPAPEETPEPLPAELVEVAAEVEEERDLEPPAAEVEAAEAVDEPAAADDVAEEPGEEPAFAVATAEPEMPPTVDDAPEDELEEQPDVPEEVQPPPAAVVEMPPTAEDLGEDVPAAVEEETDEALDTAPVLEEHEPEPRRRRFSFFRRGARADSPGTVPATPAVAEDAVVDEGSAHVDEVTALDPWEREPELPVELDEPEAQTADVAQPEPAIEPEPEPEPEPELEAEIEPEPEPDEHEEPEPEPEELPVDVLAEQAAAALERSRARRRTPRRARRR